MQEGNLVPCASCKKLTPFHGEPYNPEEELCDQCMEIAQSILHPDKKLQKVTKTDLGSEPREQFNKVIKTEEIL